jgi:hypothetical protein
MRFVYSMIKYAYTHIIFILNGKKGKESNTAERERVRDRGRVAVRGGSVGLNVFRDIWYDMSYLSHNLLMYCSFTDDLEY